MSKITTTMGRFWTALAVGSAFAVAAQPAAAGIDLVFSPTRNFATLGCNELIDIGLIARANAGVNEQISGLDVALIWDTTKLDFLGETNCFPPGGGGCPWLADGFFADADDANTNTNDGNAYYSAFAQLASPATATPAGLLVTTLHFRAKAITAGTLVSITPIYGSFDVTDVINEVGADVTGDISSTSNSVIVRPCSCALGDVNGDHVLTAADLTAAVNVLLGIDTIPAHVAAVDANCDTRANGDDIEPFITFMYLALGL